MPSKSYFYKDDTGKIKKFIYCCLCGDGPYKETERDYNFYSVHGGMSQNYCIPCARALGLSLENIKDKSTMVEKEEKIEEVFFSKSNIETTILEDNYLDSEDTEIETKNNKNNTLGIPLLFSDSESVSELNDEDKEEQLSEENTDYILHINKKKRKPLNPIKRSMPEHPSLIEEKEEIPTSSKIINKIEEKEEIPVSSELINNVDDEKKNISPTPKLIDNVEEEKIPSLPGLIDRIEDGEEEKIPASLKIVDQIKNEEKKNILVSSKEIKKEEFSTPPEITKEIFKPTEVINNTKEKEIPVFNKIIEEDKGPFYVYIGEFVDGTFLTSMTKNMKKEIKEINSGSNVIYNKLPLEVVYYHVENNKKDALQASTYIMFLDNEEKEKIINKFSEEFFKK